MTVATASASFAPLPVSVRDARRFLRGFLTEHAVVDQLGDGAELALSEIVSNAVLHAHTDFDVEVALEGHDTLRVEVHDRNPQLPRHRGYAEQATTGRGMGLVAAYTRECGVEPEPPHGKRVWFVVDAAAPPEQSEQELLDAWDLGLEDLTTGVDAGADDGSDAERATGRDGEVEEDSGTGAGRTVLLLGLPPLLWLAAREHHDAVLRELALYAAEHPQDAPDPARNALADQARGLVSTRVVTELDRHQASPPAPRHPGDRESPLPDTPPALDLQVPVPPGAAEAFGALQDVLDAAEALAVRGLLLAHPGLPEIVAVRDWACEQVISQLAGVAPAPWPGTGQDRFTHEVRDRDVPEAPHWDAGLVTDADRGAVAADDANRIIAVSRPLAAALGWAPEDLVGRRVVVLVPPELREAHVAGFTRHLTTGETHAVGVPLRLPVLRADGSRVQSDVLIEQTPARSGRAVYVAWIEPDEPADAAPSQGSDRSDRT